MIKVVHIQYAVESAGSAALRLQKAFLASNIDSCIVSLHSDITSDARIKDVSKKAKLISNLDFKLQKYLTQNLNSKFGIFSYPILGTDVSKINEVKNADFIYIHWALHGFLNLNSIAQLAKLNKPIIFFMHDMWTITGGCHHSFTCDKYLSHCSDCQMFPGSKEKDLSYKEFDKKLKLYSKYTNFYYVSPSKWLYECAKKSFLTKNKPVFCIPNVLDTTLFKPFDKKTAKKILNIDPSEIVIAFGAVSVDSPYKGWAYLQKALGILSKDKNISVLIFGSGYKKEIADAIPFKCRFMGYLKDEYSTLIAYNAADVFIAPSLADNLPFTVFESLACGTPVVAFDVGGIPDLVKHKQNGYLAEYKNVEDLADGIDFCLENKISGYLSPNFDTDVTIAEHLALFDQIKQNIC